MCAQLSSVAVVHRQGQLGLCSEALQSWPDLPAVRETLWGVLSTTSNTKLVALLVDLFASHFGLFYTTKEARREVIADLLVKGVCVRVCALGVAS